MYLLNADFTRTHVTTPAAPVFKSCQRQFTQVAVLYAGTHERHWNVSALQRSKMNLLPFTFYRKKIQAAK